MNIDEKNPKKLLANCNSIEKGLYTMTKWYLSQECKDSST